jgi:hypothetical protein
MFFLLPSFPWSRITVAVAQSHPGVMPGGNDERVIRRQF